MSPIGRTSLTRFQHDYRRIRLCLKLKTVTSLENLFDSEIQMVLFLGGLFVDVPVLSPDVCVGQVHFYDMICNRTVIETVAMAVTGAAGKMLAYDKVLVNSALLSPGMHKHNKMTLSKQHLRSIASM